MFLHTPNLLLVTKNLNTETLSLTVGTNDDGTPIGFTSANAEGPFGSLSPNRFLNTGINRLYTFSAWNSDVGNYYITGLYFYSYSHPTTNSIRLKRMDTGAAITLRPYYNGNDGYRNNNSRFFTESDLGKTFNVQLTELV